MDIKELNNNFYGPYRQLRPYNKCECWALEPDEEMQWHVTHINKCIKSLKQLNDFYESLRKVIKQEGKRFKKEKKQVIEKIKTKAREINYKDKIGKDYEVWEYGIMSCRNNQDLKIKEKNQISYLENLANEWQKRSEAEKEKLKKQEEEKNKQKQQKTQAEEAKRKNQEEEIKQKEQEFKKQFEEEQKQEPNRPTTSENKNSNDEPTNQDKQDKSSTS